MTESQDMSLPDDAAAILDRNFRTYQHYNQQRLEILRLLTPPKRDELLSLVPFLFHINHPLYPGFVQELGSNVGVYNWRVSDEVRERRKVYFPKATAAGTGISRQPMIDSLAFIGSAGTLAQTGKSDFDIWVTASAHVSEAEYHWLEKKARLIHHWLLEQDPKIDLKFYLNTAPQVKKHNFGSVSDDSAGSALGRMLKEEFYRTCVCWCGKYPIWWILPHEIRSPDEYEIWNSQLASLNIEFLPDLMDLGPLERSSPEQLLSAVMWQANKSLKSPYKSLLKLTLVTHYADNPDGDFLAEVVRRNVQSNPTHGDATDPYYCLFSECAEYWRRREDMEAVRLCADNFYRKSLGGRESKGVNSGDTKSEILWRKSREIRDTLRNYGLDKADMLALDNIENWSFAKVLAVRDRDQGFVKHIFDGVLLRLARRGIHFSNGDLEVTNEEIDESLIALLSEFSNITYKVDCFYGRARGKVEPIPPGYASMVEQQTYTIDFDSRRSRWHQWALVQDFAGPSKSTGKHEKSNEPAQTVILQADELLISSNSPAYILTWLAANRLTSSHSNLKVAIGGQRKPVGEIRKILGRLQSFLKHPLYEDALPEDAFNEAPKPYKLFVSFDLDAHSQLTGRAKELQKVSSRISRLPTDKLPEVDRITLVAQNSYGVAYAYDLPTSKYTSAHLMARMLRDFGNLPLSTLNERFVFHSADTAFHESFTQEFEAAYKRAHVEFSKLPKQESHGIRYITRVNRKYLVIVRAKDGTFKASAHDGMMELLRYLEKPVEEPLLNVVDPVAKGTERLHAIFSHTKIGHVQVFVNESQATSTMFLVDEAGSLFSDTISANLEAQISGLVFFLSKLPSERLPFADVSNGQMQVSLYDVTHSTSEGQTRFVVSPHSQKGAKQTAATMSGLLYVRIIGSFDFTQPHRAELITKTETRSLILPVDSLIQTLSDGIEAMMAKHQCSDYCILQLIQSEDSNKGSQSLEYLSLRRALNKSILHHMQKNRAPSTT